MVIDRIIVYLSVSVDNIAYITYLVIKIYIPFLPSTGLITGLYLRQKKYDIIHLYLTMILILYDTLVQ